MELSKEEFEDKLRTDITSAFLTVLNNKENIQYCAGYKIGYNIFVESTGVALAALGIELYKKLPIEEQNLIFKKMLDSLNFGFNTIVKCYNGDIITPDVSH